MTDDDSKSNNRNNPGIDNPGIDNPGIKKLRERTENAVILPFTRPDGEGEVDPATPPQPTATMFPGVLGEICNLACENSEASSVAIAANVLSCFAAAVGRGPFQAIGDGVLHPRPFTLLVGRTSKARKGTAEKTPQRIFRVVDEILRQRQKAGGGEHFPLQVYSGGLSTGEGLISAIRDTSEDDPGVKDKRLLILEAEFATVMAHAHREGNILSMTLRKLWDGDTVAPMIKHNRITATRPHVVVLGHITIAELLQRMAEVDAANGLLNRFVSLFVCRQRLLPDPQPTDAESIRTLALKLADLVFAVRGNGEDDPCKQECTREIRFDTQAKAHWHAVYPKVSRDWPTVGGALLARSETYVRMFAMIFALLAGRTEMTLDDLKSALAWWRYWRESVDHIFHLDHERGVEKRIDNLAQRLIEILGKAGADGCTVKELHRQTSGHVSGEQMREALSSLCSRAVLPRIEKTTDEATGGRPATRYRIVTEPTEI